MLAKIVKRLIFSISILIFTVISISLYMIVDNTFTFVIIESFFLFIFAGILFINNKINNHINSKKEVNRVYNILVKHYPDEKQMHAIDRTSDNDGGGKIHYGSWNSFRYDESGIRWM